MGRHYQRRGQYIRDGNSRNDNTVFRLQMDSTATSALAAKAERPTLVRAKLYIAIVICALLGTLAYKLRIDGIFACPIGDAGSYLADCNARGYGDYDHGAFWYSLEPDAERAVRNADVLFLGSSRLEFAFSTNATRHWFLSRAATFYLLGFSHTENVAFVGPLLGKLRPRASVYVINVDRFFSTSETPPASELLHDPSSQTRYEDKRSWQPLHRVVCGQWPALCGEQIAIFRARDTGTWQRLGTAPFEPSAVADGVPTDMDRWQDFAAIGATFLQHLPVARGCVVLTIVPNGETRRAEARSIAAAMQLPLVEPTVEGLRTFDGSHLDHESADRWSAAFFALAGPTIQRCLTKQASPPAPNG